MARTRRTFTTVTLLATLALVPSLAGARQTATPKTHAAVHATSIHSGSDLLSRLWHGLRSLWGKEGMLIDPNGAHINGAATQTSGAGATADAGVLIDPNG